MRMTRLLPLAILTLASSALAAEPAHAPAAQAKAPAPAPAPVAKAAPVAKPAPLPANVHVPVPSPGAAHSPPAKPANVLHAPVAPAPFPAAKVATGDAAKLRALIVGGHAAATHAGPSAPVDKAIEQNVHLLMSAGPEAYDQVLVTPSHVALVRKSGIVDLVSHADAKAQIASGKAHENKRVQIGIGPRGFPLFGEEGPNGSLRLYRQLPVTAKGEVPSIDDFTSFALTGDDAFHPWGEAGHTVTITIPHELLERIKTGELGGTGWLGHGGIAIDVVQEVQIETKVLKAHLAGNWKDALKK